MKTIWIAADHAGFALKQALMDKLKGFEIKDLGCFSQDSVDYPDFANLVSREIQNKTHDQGFGILVCGSGQGMVMRANKFPWVRAALVWNLEIVKLCREHNNANILCLPSRFISESEALQFAQIFDSTQFAEGRHSPRVAKVNAPL